MFGVSDFRYDRALHTYSIKINKFIKEVIKKKYNLYLRWSPDEPIGGVDPAARDYITYVIISNYIEDTSSYFYTHDCGCRTCIK